jgi:hypothetical protein
MTFRHNMCEIRDGNHRQHRYHPEPAGRTIPAGGTGLAAR